MSSNILIVTAFTLICPICKNGIEPVDFGKKSEQKSYEKGIDNHYKSQKHLKECLNSNCMVNYQTTQLYFSAYSDMLHLAKTFYLIKDDSERKEYIIKQFMDLHDIKVLPKVLKRITNCKNADITEYTLNKGITKYNNINKDDLIFCELFYFCLNKVKTILSLDQSMKVIPSNCASKMKLLEAIGKYIVKETTMIYTIMKKLSTGANDIPSATYIQGNRLEIFIDVIIKEGTIKQDNKVWMKMMEHFLHHDLYLSYSTEKVSPEIITNEILSYCSTQANKDCRILGTDSYKFSNFALIITYDPAKQQVQHLDSIHPNYQFGLSLCNKSPITRYWKTKENDSIISLHDIKNTLLSGISKELLEMMNCNNEITNLMEEFGNLFIQKEQQEVGKHLVSPLMTKTVTKLNVGDMTSFPGSVLHAGPTCKQSRFIIFFTGCPKSKHNDIQYNPGIQYHKWTLFMELIFKMWPELTPAQMHYKKELLNMLKTIIVHSDIDIGMDDLPSSYKGLVRDYFSCCIQSMTLNKKKGKKKRKRISSTSERDIEADVERDIDRIIDNLCRENKID
jgi:hypothetical protein